MPDDVCSPEQRMQWSRFWHDWYELGPDVAEAFEQENGLAGLHTIRFNAYWAIQAATTPWVPLGVLMDDQS